MVDYRGDNQSMPNYLTSSLTLDYGGRDNNSYMKGIFKIIKIQNYAKKIIIKIKQLHFQKIEFTLF